MPDDVSLGSPMVLSNSYIANAYPVAAEADDVLDAVGRLHSHEFFEFVYVVRGLLTHVLSGVGTILGPGDMFIVAPGSTHAYHRPRNALIYNCRFTREAFAEELGELRHLPIVGAMLAGETGGAQCKAHLRPGRAQAVSAIVEKLIDESAKDREGKSTALKGLLFQLLVEIGRGYGDSTTPLPPHMLGYTHRFIAVAESIHEHLGQNIRVGDLAAEAGVSAEHFSRLFTRLFGLTPLAYIHHLRVSKAMTLLTTTDCTVAEVAVECGVPDQNHFTRLFRKIVGMTPSAFRRTAAGIMGPPA